VLSWSNAQVTDSRISGQLELAGKTLVSERSLSQVLGLTACSNVGLSKNSNCEWAQSSITCSQSQELLQKILQKTPQSCDEIARAPR
jgi:hypothetical protein